MSKVKVSILCVAYNHSKFIRQTLDGFVNQKTNFTFEVLINDDASADDTADIIREYANAYPDIIKPVFQTENQYSRGVLVTQTYLYPKVRGKYVAVCDGDDYWTDPLKLQKQVDYLDRHPDCTVCFHPVSIFWDDGSRPEYVWPTKKHIKRISLDNLLRDNFIPNCSVMYRWQPNGLDVVKQWPANIYPGDLFLHLLHAKHGKIGFLPDVMACYRKHPAGISFAAEYGLEELHKIYGLKELNLYLELEKNLAPNPELYHSFVRSKAREILAAYSKNKDFESATQVLKMCPDLMIDCANKSDVARWHHNFNNLVIICAILLITVLVMGGLL